MLAVKNQQLNSVFERIVRDKDGSYLCVRFIVVETNGSFQPQIVSITPLKSPCGKVACLPISISPKKILSEDLSFVPEVISPFTKLFFFNSQPTRAPSFK